MTHFSWHSYSGGPANPAAPRGGINADWMTETSKWCSGCDNNQPPGESEWSFGSGIGDILLGDIENGFSAVLTWEGFDTYYYHHDSYSAWGHVGCTQNGSGCTTSDVYPRVYTIRGRAWPEATIAKAISPGMVRRGLTTALPNLTALSFYDSATGKFSIVGHNTGSSQITINGQLQNLPAVSSLSLYETNASLHLQRMNDVAVNGGLFTATILADTFFYLTNTAAIQASTPTPTITATQIATSTPTPIPTLPQQGPQTIFSTQIPAGTFTDGVNINYELGTRFRANVGGQVTAIRFYKSANESGIHTGRIWNSSGQLLAIVVFSGETSSGWQQQDLTTPLNIAANTEYMVTVNTGNTYYVATNNGLNSQIRNGNLQTIVGSNGRYGPVGVYPLDSWQNSNYFRDIVFVPAS